VEAAGFDRPPRHRDAKAGEEVWKDPGAEIGQACKCIGPVWVGRRPAGRAGTTGDRPGRDLDDPTARPAEEAINGSKSSRRALRPTRRPRTPTPLDRAVKRLFDICLHVCLSLILWPMLPLIPVR